MNNSSIAIQVRGLRKSYGDVEAVRGIDLEIPTGEVFALLGPNGAGKTTTIEILEGYLNKSAGEVQVLGYDPARKQREFRERIGIVLQSTGVQPYLNVEETIDLFRGYYPHPMALEDVLHATGLGPQRKTRVKKLSGGSSVGSTSPLASPETRTCSSWTSPPPASTPRPAGTRGR